MEEHKVFMKPKSFTPSRDIRACPVCSSTEREFAARKGEFCFYRCHCSTVYIDRATEIPMPDEYWETFSTEEYQRGQREIVPVIEKYLPDHPVSILDIGCGIGTTVDEFLARGHRAMGIEKYHRAKLLTEKYHPNAVGCIEIADFDRWDKQIIFDAVLLNNVFEHLPDPHDILRKIHQLLAPSGLLVIMVPNAAKWDSNNNAWIHVNTKTPGEHCNLYTEASFAFLAGLHKFEIIYLDPSAFNDSLWVFLRKIS